MFYYQLGNLSPEYQSSIKSIHLVAIARSSVIAKYGANKILEPFMQDIRQLEKVQMHLTMCVLCVCVTD